MSTIFLRKRLFCLTSVTVAVLGSSLSAVAQTVNTSSNQLTELSATGSPDQINAQVTTQSQNSTQISINNFSVVNPGSVSDSTGVQQFPSVATQTASSMLTPVPGTTSTSSAALIAEYPSTLR